MDYKQTLMWKELNQAPQVIKSCAANNQEILEEIANAFFSKKINYIYVVARGTSSHALLYFKYLMEVTCGIPVAVGAPGVITLYNGKLNLSNSLVIGCSQSGEAVDVLSVMQRANSQGALTVSITNYKDSPMANESSFHLFLSAGEEKSVAATKTFTAQLAILLCLAAKLGGSNAFAEKLSLAAEEVNENLTKIDQLTTTFADKYKDIKDGFVLGRGYAYPIALEAALKLQETSYIAVKGYATSDFFHGPMAMVNEATPVIFYAPEYKNESLAENIFCDEVKGIDKMLSLKARVLVVTDDKKIKAKYQDICDVAFLPCTSEYFAIFSFVLFAQMFANKISCLIGNNPDSPRALNKVTITK